MSAQGPGPGYVFDPDAILHHADGFLAIAKPAGLVVQKGTGHESGGLVEALESWVSVNPGVLHTAPGKVLHVLTPLEREASGIVLLGLSPLAAEKFRAAEEPRREFLAVVAGELAAEGELAGKVRAKRGHAGRRQERIEARLEFRKLAGDERLSLVEVKCRAHRQHQIRSLFHEAGRPLAGDLRFGRPKPSQLFLERYGLEGLLLHLRRLVFRAGSLELEIECPTPPSFAALAEAKGWDLTSLPGSETPPDAAAPDVTAPDAAAPDQAADAESSSRDGLSA